MSSSMLAALRTEEQKVEDDTTLPSIFKCRFWKEKATVIGKISYEYFKTSQSEMYFMNFGQNQKKEFQLF